jgi:hypothetical protein
MFAAFGIMEHGSLQVRFHTFDRFYVCYCATIIFVGWNDKNQGVLLASDESQLDAVASRPVH